MCYGVGFSRMCEKAHRRSSATTASANGNGQRTAAYASYGASAQGTSHCFAIAEHSRRDAGKATSASTSAPHAQPNRGDGDTASRHC